MNAGAIFFGPLAKGERLYCNSCGAQNQSSSRFCVGCGANLDVQRAAQSSAPPLLTSPVAPPTASTHQTSIAPPVASSGGIDRAALLIGGVGWILTGLPQIGFAPYFAQAFGFQFRPLEIFLTAGYLLMSIAVAMSWRSLRRHVPVGALVAVAAGLTITTISQGYFVVANSFANSVENIYDSTFALSFVVSGVGVIIGGIGLRRQSAPSA